jgi:hypothetical protein
VYTRQVAIVARDGTKTFRFNAKYSSKAVTGDFLAPWRREKYVHVHAFQSSAIHSKYHSLRQPSHEVAGYFELEEWRKSG